MRRTPLLALVLLPLPATAQEDAPLSAIDWLSQSVAAAALTPGGTAPRILDEPPVAEDASTPDITVSSLDSPSPDGTACWDPR